MAEVTTPNRVTPRALRDLLGAYRAVLTGNASPTDTPAVPTSLAGYVESDGVRLPLGRVRRSLLERVAACGELTDLERTVVVLYYGLELDCWPLTSSGAGDVLANSLLRRQVPPRGRPPKRPGPHLGDEGVKYEKEKALRKLARSWEPLPGAEPVAVHTEPEPLSATWLATACAEQDWLGYRLPPHGTAKHRTLVVTALRWARSQAGSTIRVDAARALDEELDRWAYESGVFVVARGAAPGRVDAAGEDASSPGRPVDGPDVTSPAAKARARARMSIALWEVLEDPRLQPSVRRRPVPSTPSVATLTVATPDLQMVLDEDEVDAAVSAIEGLEELIADGRPCDAAFALTLGWLRPRVMGPLDAEWCGRAAVVTTKAAAESPRELGTIGLPWLETACAKGADEAMLAEGSLNLSVTHSARRRYPEAEAALHRFVDPERASTRALGTVEIGKSAWRRRRVSSALENVRGVGQEELPLWAAFSTRHGIAAVEKLRLAGAPMADMLRAQVRVAEAVALQSAVHQLHRNDKRPSPTWEKKRDKMQRDAAWIQDQARQTYERGLQEGPVTAFDMARRDVIHEARDAVDVGNSLIQFTMMSRVRSYEAAVS